VRYNRRITLTEYEDAITVKLTATKDRTCYVCGPDNPVGLHVPFEKDGEAGSTAVYLARKEHGGWNGILHGGVTFSLMDEAFGWCLYLQNIPAVTARVETRFHKPIPIGTRLHIRAWVVGKRRRLYDARAEVRVDNASGLLVAESDAVLCSVAQSDASADEEAVATMNG
jgi:acyl-coenzyme A thioesterase PaaI-like protein